MKYWFDPIYQQTALTVISVIVLSGALIYFFRNKSHYFKISWASIKSWMFAAPILFFSLGAPEPFPLIFLTLLAMGGAKTFFQIFGMYHRHYFVYTCYLGIIALAYATHTNRLDLYNLMPMAVFGITCLIPLVRNQFRRMIQYMSLTLLAFIFMGWSFMHLGLILKFENGIYQLMYLIILAEFCDNTILAISRYIGKIQFVSQINPRRTIESTVVSILLTIALAFGMRHLLPDGSEKYYLISALIAGLGGGAGDLVMTVIRRDLGIRDYGAFILGRGDLLNRMDRLIFVAPIYYHVMHNLPS